MSMEREHGGGKGRECGTGDGSRWGARVGGLAIVLAVGAAYSGSLRAPFILDDLGVIPVSPAIRTLWPIWPVLAAPSEPGSTTQGRPLVALSLAICYALGGPDNVLPYHAFNLAVHALAALALYGIARRTLAAPGVPPALRGSSAGLALTIALVWALHPLATSAVTYVIQRAESMMGLLYLATLYCAIRGAASPRPAGWYAAAAAACAAGMATKEVMVTAPLAVLLYDRAFLAGSFRAALRRRGALYAALAASWGLLGVLVAFSGGRGGSAGFGQGLGVAAYALTQPGAILHYLRLALVPYPLCLDYGTPVASSLGSILPASAAVAALLAATAWALVRRPRWGFLGGAFFLLLAPSSSVVPIVTQTVAEHRMYLPLAVVAAAAVAGAGLLANRILHPAADPRRPRGPRRRRAARGFGTGLVLAVVVALGGLTFLRNRDYRSPIVLWEQTLTVVPGNPRAHHCLAVAYADAGHPAQALAHFDRAAQLDPRDATILLDRADLFRDQGRSERALADYTKAVELKPSLAVAYNDRGLVRMDRREYDEAIRDFDRALALEPDQATGYLNRAICRYRMRDFAAARADVQRCIQRGGRPPEGFLQALHAAPR